LFGEHSDLVYKHTVAEGLFVPIPNSWGVAASPNNFQSTVSQAGVPPRAFLTESAFFIQKTIRQDRFSDL